MNQDNINVVVRVRGQTDKNEFETEKSWNFSENTIYNDKDKFTFDRVFGSNDQTSKIYDEKVKPIVIDAMNGINGSVLAYGQTSSGKTFTMMGTSTQDGIIKHCLRDIFSIIENTPSFIFLIRMTYIEIYNEQVVDLFKAAKLNDVVSKEENHLKEILETSEISKENKEAKYMEVIVRDADCCLAYLSMGEKSRHFASTNMNEKSSRSHCILRVIIENSDQSDDKSKSICRVSWLDLVDLAGSERKKSTNTVGQQFVEACHINTSLFHLANVIRLLSSKQNKTQHIGYRDSKLTFFLQESLGGNSKCTIICMVRLDSYHESKSTLQFAQSAKNVKNRPIVNTIFSDKALLGKSKKEIAQLQNELDQVSMNLKRMEEMNESKESEMNELKKRLEEFESNIHNIENRFCFSSRCPDTGIDARNLKRRRETWCPGKEAFVFRPTFDFPMELDKENIEPNSNSMKKLSEPMDEIFVKKECDTLLQELKTSQQEVQQLKKELLTIKTENYKLNDEMRKYHDFVKSKKILKLKVDSLTSHFQSSKKSIYEEYEDFILFLEIELEICKEEMNSTNANYHLDCVTNTRLFLENDTIINNECDKTNDVKLTEMNTNLFEDNQFYANKLMLLNEQIENIINNELENSNIENNTTNFQQDNFKDFIIELKKKIYLEFNKCISLDKTDLNDCQKTNYNLDGSSVELPFIIKDSAENHLDEDTNKDTLQINDSNLDVICKDAFNSSLLNMEQRNQELNMDAQNEADKMKNLVHIITTLRHNLRQLKEELANQKVYFNELLTDAQKDLLFIKDLWQGKVEKTNIDILENNTLLQELELCKMELLSFKKDGTKVFENFSKDENICEDTQPLSLILKNYLKQFYKKLEDSQNYNVQLNLLLNEKENQLSSVNLSNNNYLRIIEEFEFENIKLKNGLNDIKNEYFQKIEYNENFDLNEDTSLKDIREGICNLLLKIKEHDAASDIFAEYKKEKETEIRDLKFTIDSHLDDFENNKEEFILLLNELISKLYYPYKKGIPENMTETLNIFNNMIYSKNTFFESLNLKLKMFIEKIVNLNEMLLLDINNKLQKYENLHTQFDTYKDESIMFKNSIISIFNSNFNKNTDNELTNTNDYLSCSSISYESIANKLNESIQELVLQLREKQSESSKNIDLLNEINRMEIKLKESLISKEQCVSEYESFKVNSLAFKNKIINIVNDYFKYNTNNEETIIYKDFIEDDEKMSVENLACTLQNYIADLFSELKEKKEQINEHDNLINQLLQKNCKKEINLTENLHNNDEMNIKLFELPCMELNNENLIKNEASFDVVKTNDVTIPAIIVNNLISNQENQCYDNQIFEESIKLDDDFILDHPRIKCDNVVVSIDNFQIDEKKDLHMIDENGQKSMTDLNKNLQKYVDDLQHRITELQTEINSMQLRNDTLNTNISDLKLNINKLQLENNHCAQIYIDEKTTLEKKLADKEDEFEEKILEIKNKAFKILEEELTRKNEEYKQNIFNQFEDEKQLLINDINILKEKLNNDKQEEKIYCLNEHIKVLETESKKLKDALSNNQEEWLKNKLQLIEEIASLKNEFENITRINEDCSASCEINEYKQSNEMLIIKIKELEEIIQTMLNKENNLVCDNNSLDKKIKDLINNIDDKEKEWKSLRENFEIEVNVLKNEIQELENYKLKNNLCSLESKHNDSFAHSNDDKQTRENIILEYEIKINNLDEIICRLNNEIRLNLNDISKLEEESHIIKNENTILKSKLEECNSRICKLTDEFSAQLQLNTEKSNELLKLQSNYDKISNDFENFKNNLLNKKIILHEEYDLIISDIANKEKMNDTIKLELCELRCKFEDLMKTNQDLNVIVHSKTQKSEDLILLNNELNAKVKLFNDLNMENECLKSNLDAIEKDRNILKDLLLSKSNKCEELLALNNEYLEKETLFKDIDHKLNSIKSEYDQLIRNHDSLKGNLVLKTQECEELLKTINGTNILMKDQKSELDSLRDIYSKLISEKEDLETTLLHETKKCAELDLAKKDLENKLKEYYILLDKYNALLSDLDKKNTLYQSKSLECEQLIKNLNEQSYTVDSLTADVVRLKSKLEEHKCCEAKISDLNNKLKEYYILLDKYNTLLPELDKKNTLYKSKSLECDQLIKDLNNQTHAIENLTANIVSLKSKLEEHECCEGKISEYTSKIETLENEVKNLNKLLDDGDEYAYNSDKTIVDLDKKIKNYEDQCKRFQNEITRLQKHHGDEKNSLIKENKMLREELAKNAGNLQTKVDQLTQDLEVEKRNFNYLSYRIFIGRSIYRKFIRNMQNENFVWQEKCIILEKENKRLESSSSSSSSSSSAMMFASQGRKRGDPSMGSGELPAAGIPLQYYEKQMQERIRIQAKEIDCLKKEIDSFCNLQEELVKLKKRHNNLQLQRLTTDEDILKQLKLEREEVRQLVIHLNDEQNIKEEISKFARGDYGIYDSENTIRNKESAIPNSGECAQQ